MKLEQVEKGVQWAGGVGALAFLVVAYAGLWRGMGRERGRKTGVAPDGMRTLRYYAGAGVAGLVLARRMWRPLPWQVSGAARAAALVVGALLYFGGLALMFWGRFTLGRNYDVSSAFGAQLYADQELVTEGPFAVVRHPMYVGGTLWAAGAALLYRTWLALVVALTLPLSLGKRAQHEEAALAAAFGERYEAYRRRVPRFVPRKVWRA